MERYPNNTRCLQKKPPFLSERNHHAVRYSQSAQPPTFMPAGPLKTNELERVQRGAIQTAQTQSAASRAARMNSHWATTQSVQDLSGRPICSSRRSSPARAVASETQMGNVSCRRWAWAGFAGLRRNRGATAPRPPRNRARLSMHDHYTSETRYIADRS